MKTASYAHSLYNSTAFTQVQKGDGYGSYAWKIPTGRVLSSAVTLIALAEALFFSLATVAFSPLYVLDNERFHVLADDAKDSANTAAKAAGRIFGFGLIETEELSAPPAPAPKPPAKPTTLKGRTLAFIKARAADVGYTALKHPNATLVVTTLAVTATAAYYLGLFDYAASLLSSPDAPDMARTITGTADQTAPVVDSGLFNATPPLPAQATAQTVRAVVDNGFCPASLGNATSFAATLPPAAKSQMTVWAAAEKVASACKNLTAGC